MTAALRGVYAKSAQGGRAAELLTDHSAQTLAAAGELRRRLGRIQLAEDVLDGAFWKVVAWAALCHDAGKIASGFQDMIRGLIRSWGQRHELLSLGFLPLLVDDERLRLWVASGVLTHHRQLAGPVLGARKPCIEQLYAGQSVAQLRAMLGPVDATVAADMLGWLAATAGTAGLDSVAASAAVARPQATVGPDSAGPHGPAGPPGGTCARHESDHGPDVVALAHGLLHDVVDHWRDWLDEEQNLTAILVQGAVTLADHLSSAHGTLLTEQPIGPGFAARLAADFTAQGRHLHRHQMQASEVHGHLLLRAPTGTGKTEAGLLWAAQQVSDLMAAVGGVPRVFFTLPYLASINAMAGRLGELPGGAQVTGVSHSRAASYHLAVAISADDDPDDTARVAAASKAVSRAAATRLFRETVRVSTPYQLLRGALAGPVHAGIVIDSTNSVFILDELHAYDPKRLGFILAAARLWERLGGRIAVLSATLPAALADLITDTLHKPVHTVSADVDCAPARHRVSIRGHALTSPAAPDEISARVATGQAVLVVANTVAQAQQLFAELAPAARQRHSRDGDNSEDAAVLLHSRYKRIDRSDIEQRITARYATTPGRRHSRRVGGLVVATQVVEVSLDVDFDVLFTSAAPLEALLQRFGRVNRLAARDPADVIVHQPTFGPRRGRGDGEYADGIYEREPVEASWQILRAHDGHIIDEPVAGGWLDTIYATGWGQRWRAEVTKHWEDFHREFLSFNEPLTDRSHLAEAFDEMFEGTEAILQTDQAGYQAALTMADRPAAGRLIADDFLIPMPAYATAMTRPDRQLGVNIIDGEYNRQQGLISVRGVDRDWYQPGELI